MGKKVKNVTKVVRPPLDEPAPFKADIILFWVIQISIATVLFFLFSYGLIESDVVPIITKFFSLLGVYLVSDTISGYIASLVTTALFKKTYNPVYFKHWFIGTRKNVLRLVIWWVFSAAIYLSTIESGLSTMIFGETTLWTDVVTYLIVKAIAFVLTELISKYLITIDHQP